MRKLSLAMLTTFTITSMAIGSTAVSADDITVRVPAGGGTITFEEGAETDITSEEFADLFKKGTKALTEQNFYTTTYLEGRVSVNLGAETSTNMNGWSAIQTQKSGDESYAKVNYGYSLFGQDNSGEFEAYAWTDGDTDYAAHSVNGNWEVTVAPKVDDLIDIVLNKIENAEVSKLEGVTPEQHLYETNGTNYYVCKLDARTALSTAGNFDALSAYVDSAKSILGDIDFSVVLIINADTGVPYIFTIDASESKGSLPGSVLGSDTGIEYSADELYLTVVMHEDSSELVIPEEVKSAPQKNIDFAGLFGKAKDKADSVAN